MIIRFIFLLNGFCKLCQAILRKKLTFWEKNIKLTQQSSLQINSEKNIITLENIHPRSKDRPYFLDEFLFYIIFAGCELSV